MLSDFKTLAQIYFAGRVRLAISFVHIRTAKITNPVFLTIHKTPAHPIIHNANLSLTAIIKALAAYHRRFLFSFYMG